MRTVSLCKPRFARFGIDRLRARFTYEMKNVFNVITVIQYAHHHFRIQPLQKKHFAESVPQTVNNSNEPIERSFKNDEWI